MSTCVVDFFFPVKGTLDLPWEGGQGYVIGHPNNCYWSLFFALFLAIYPPPLQPTNQPDPLSP